MKRPTSVSIIAWFLIVTTALSVIFGVYGMNDPIAQALMAKSPLSIPLQYGMMFVGLIITLAAGGAMLKGLKWGRSLYLGWGVIGTIIGVLTSPVKTMLIPGVLVLAIFGFFLYRPKANAFFNRTAANDA